MTELPEDAEIIGRLNRFCYLDINKNRRRDCGEPSGPGVLGVMRRGFGRIVFCGDANLCLLVPQPLVRNTLAWLDGP